MESHETNIIGLILAGGRARRMGGLDKAFVPLHGRALIEHVIARAAPQVDELLVNMNERPRQKQFSHPILPDGVGGFLGPLAGILTGLDWMKENRPLARWLATFPCDTPFLPGDCVRRLIERADSRGALAACAASGGRRHHVCAVLSAAIGETAHSVLNRRGLRKVEDFFALLPHTEAEFSCDPCDPFFNVNTLDDLAVAEAFMAKARPMG